MKTNPVGRLLNILDYALWSLRRKLLKNATVFCVFTLVVFLFSSFQLVRIALTEAAGQILSTTPDITVQQMSAGRQTSIAASAVDDLATIFGIKKINKRIWGYYFDESNGANYTVIGMAPQLDESERANWIGLSSGRVPAVHERGAVVVSESIREHLQLGDRKHFSLFRPDLTLIPFQTVGIFNRKWDIVTGDLMLMNLEDGRDLFAIPADSVTDLLVYVGNPDELETIAGKISERLPGTRVITRNQILKTYKVVFNWRSGLGTICLLTTLIAFVILAWDKASGLSQEEIREVGILKILGWQTNDLILLRFCESISVSLLAFLTGYLLAWVHVVYFDGTLLRPIFLGWSVVRPVFHLVPPFAFSDMLLIFSISVIPYLCATAVPAWRAAVVRADSVL
jgi:ABC-type lipoprotein release transport system permease subunit